MSGLEVIGVVASIAGIIDVASRVTGDVANYANAVKNHEGSIKELQAGLRSMNDTLSHIQKSIDEVDDRSDQSLIGILQGSGADPGEIEECHRTLGELEKLLQKYEVADKKPGKFEFSRYKAKSRKWSSPITDEDIREFTSRLGVHCGKLSLNIGVDTNRQVRQLQAREQQLQSIGEDTNHKVTEIRTQLQLIGGTNVSKKLPYAERAAYNHRTWEHEGLCLPNTRVQLRQQITEWYENPTSPCIFWLNGMAGTGKSTISRTVAYELAGKGKLAASFFFSRGRGDISHAGMFFTTIATQLAEHVPELRPLISKAIDDHPDIHTRRLRDQWQLLIYGPLENAPTQSKQIVVVIDALDECEDKKDIELILELLANAKDLKTIRLRVFVTSRPETPISFGFRNMLGGTHQDFVLHDIPPPTINQDISVFFQQKLSEVKSKRGLSTPWPDEPTIQLLVERAAGLFIYAATTYRFIQGGADPKAQLSVILSGKYTPAESLTGNLDEMYTKLLEYSVIGDRRSREHKVLKRFKQVVGSIVILFDVMTAENLANLLCLPSGEVKTALDSLHSVLNIPNDESQPVRIFHPSFRDFLLDQERCNNKFWIDEKERHIDLFRHCVELMSKHLQQDICGIREPGVLITEISMDMIQSVITADLRYACRYWVHHFQQGNSVEEDSRILQFLMQHLLHWLEVLSLVGEVSEGVLMIASLEKILKEKSNDDALLALIYDARRFTRSNRFVIEKAPLQLYYAGLLFSPERSLVRKQHYGGVPFIQWDPTVEQRWSSLIQTLEGHLSQVTAVVFSPDGKLVASASKDKTVRLWDPATGESCGVLKGHSQYINTVVFSPDGKLVASTSGDYTVRLWDPATGKSCGVLKGHSQYINAVVFSPDGKLVASTSADCTVRLWDPATGKSCGVLMGHWGSVNAVVFSPDGKLVASASWDNTVRLWDPVIGGSCGVLKGHSEGVNAVVFSLDGKLVASASYDKTVRLWDPATGKSCGILKGHSGSVKAVVFSPDGKLVASASDDYTVRLWDLTIGKSCGVLRGHLGNVNAVVFSPDGKLVASASHDRTVRLWDPATGKVTSTLLDKMVRLWGLATGEGHSAAVGRVVFSPDGKMVVSTSHDHTVRLWDPATGESYGVLRGHVSGVVFSPDGRLLASVSDNERVRLWDPATGKSCRVLRASYVNAVVFSPDGKLVASASYDKTVRLWDPATGESCGVLKGHSGCVYAVVFSLDGKLVASASRDQTVRLWDIDLATEESCAVLQGHFGPVRAVVFSPDGKLVASASDDYTVRLWDLATGESCGVLKGHSGSVNAVVFSPDGKLVASASWDNTVRLWDVIQKTTIEEIPTGASIWHLNFTDRTQLDTDRGVLTLTSQLHPSTSTQATFPSINITIDGWVTWNKKRVLFLPVDYRPSTTAAKDNILVMGYKSGRVIFLRFNPTALAL